VHKSLELMFSGALAKSSVIAQYAVCAFWRYGMPTLITCSQYPEKLITFVPDRLGHDRRYALDSSKLCSSLNWAADSPVMESLVRSVGWLRGSW